MNKGFAVLVVVILIAITTLFGYLVYKTWEIFGFWTMTWTGLTTALSGTILGQIIGSRNESGGKVIYNPKEWPKFVNITISALIGYYLYTIISKTKIESEDYYFGLCYLIILTLLPILWAVYKLIRDRNDFVEIDDKYLTYKDNHKSGKFELSEISKIEGALTIHFADESTHEIELTNMNFNAADISSLKSDIQSRLQQAEKLLSADLQD